MRTVPGWRAHVASATNEVLAAWESRVDAAFAPELGGLLGPEALAKYGEYKGSLEAGLRREMERVALQGELSLTVRRLYDQYSLRKKSESATADAIADQIVRETRAQTDEGIAADQIGAGAESGLRGFQRPFDRCAAMVGKLQDSIREGLSKWDSAEEKFPHQPHGVGERRGELLHGRGRRVVLRIRQAEDRETKLGAAGGRTSPARGGTVGAVQDRPASAIESARGEFQKERTERISAMQDQVGALVDMYAQSVQVISTAVSSGQELVGEAQHQGRKRRVREVLQGCGARGDCLEAADVGGIYQLAECRNCET